MELKSSVNGSISKWQGGTKNECMHMERIVNKHHIALNMLKEADLTIAAIQT